MVGTSTALYWRCTELDRLYAAQLHNNYRASSAISDSSNARSRSAHAPETNACTLALHYFNYIINIMHKSMRNDKMKVGKMTRAQCRVPQRTSQHITHWSAVSCRLQRNLRLSKSSDLRFSHHRHNTHTN